MGGLLVHVAMACSTPDATDSELPTDQAAAGNGGEIDQVNRIAYVSPNRDLFTVAPDGNELSQLTGKLQADGQQGGTQAQPLMMNQYHTWPTWSADGTRLAASRVIVEESGARISLQALDARNGSSETIYEDGQAGLVADGAPHYIYWAPTGDQVSFLAATPNGLTLFVWDGTAGSPAAQIDRGAPLYYQWSKDAQAMVLHIGPELIWTNSSNADSSRHSFQSAGNFRVPAVSPDGLSLAYVDRTIDGAGLYLAPTSDLSQARKIVDVGWSSAIMWSPDGTQIGVADQSVSRTQLFDRLLLVSVDGGPETTIVSKETGKVLWAFFWAPTGDRLAWVSVNGANQELELMVSATDGSDAKELFSFKPSAEIFIMMSFFDQYAHSHSLWSPDGTSLVVAGTKGEAARRSNGRTPTGDRIYVLDAGGSSGPRDLGAGVLAVWSWN